MKVFIGPYPDDGVNDQEMIIEIDRYDTWSMDHTLAHIILPMLQQLKETKHGAPHVDDDDVPWALASCNGPAKEHEWDTDDNWFKRWDYVLDEMIWAFQQKMTNWEDQYHSGKHDTWMQPLDKDENPIGEPYKWGDGVDREKAEGEELYQMIKGPNDTHVWDQQGHTKHQERISNGFRLFGKYYENLWD